MFCEKCGAKLVEDALFCGECGAKVRTASIVDAQPENVSEQNASSNSEETKNSETQGTSTNATTPNVTIDVNAAKDKVLEKVKSFGSLPPKIYGIIGAAVVALIAIIVIAAGAKRKINLNDYMTVDFTGYDTVGKAEINFDSDQFFSDVLEKTTNKKIKKLMKGKDIEDTIDWDDAIELLTYLDSVGVDYSLDKTSDLSNGDEVVLTWDVDEDEIKEDYGIKIKYSDETYTVSGLESVETFDPFEYVEVVYTGIDPNGQASVNVTTNNELTNALNFSLDASSNLKNGDTITVTADSYYGNDTAAYFAENYGKIPSPTTKEYTVEGLGKYASTVSEIPETLMSQMQQQATDAFTADFVSEWGTDVAIDNFQYIGYHFLTPKDSTNSGNRLYLVYQVNVNYLDDTAGTVWLKYFWTISYPDIMILPDGTGSADIMDYYVPYNDFSVSVDVKYRSYYYFTGFSDLTSLQNECATQYLANWNIESNVTETN